jgi:TolA-binding protein
VAASLDAQGKFDLAVGAYQKAANQSSDGSVVAAAKFALAQIDEQQGRMSDAQKLYEEITRTFPNSSLASEATLRSVEMKSPAASMPSPAANAPFSLSH